MSPISRHYRITKTTPFLDVDIDTDNRMFIDPCAIRLDRTPSRFTTAANLCTETFFAEVTRCVLSVNTVDRRRALQSLQCFVEPWETRLGMARNGFRGHGGAEDVGTWIWSALNTKLEALVRVGVLQQIEDLPLFVEGIDRDITSDITTRIIFEPLAQFTEHILDQFPEFGSAGNHVETFYRQVWNPQICEWTRRKFILPVAAGKPLILVPRSWARPALLMSAGRYYETSVLGYAQLEQAIMTNDGKLLKTSKDVLKTHPGLGRGRSTNLNVTHRAHSRDDDLLAQFRSFVNSRWMQPEGDDAQRAA